MNSLIDKIMLLETQISNLEHRLIHAESELKEIKAKANSCNDKCESRSNQGDA